MIENPENDGGIIINRGNQNNAFIGFSEDADRFTMGTGVFSGTSTGYLAADYGILEIAGIVNPTNNENITLTTSGNGKVESSNGFISKGSGDVPGSLQLFDNDDSHYVSIKAAAEISVDYDFILPQSLGNNGEVLTINNQNGNLIWAPLCFIIIR